MDLDNSTGVGDVPDNSVSADTPPIVTGITAPEIASPAPEAIEEVKTISEEFEKSDEISDDIQSEMESVIEANANDSELVKKLRNIVKTKYEDYSSRVKPELTEAQSQAIELANGLFEFDVERGTATTRNFAENLAKRDMNVAAQAFDDLSAIPVGDNGFTLGHKFLESIGLDPYKIEELRQFSRGELNPTDYGITTVHAKVPKELSEAYKSLDPVTRTDVDIYLDGENEAQSQAALRTLRNQQAVIDNDKWRQESQTRQQTQFNQEVGQALETDLDATFTGVLSTLKTNPAYVGVTLSSDKAVDSLVKDSVIAQLNALGDPRSVLAKQAVASFESHGVKVDTAKIGQLMQTIEDSTKVAISAEKMGKLQNKDYTTQIQEAQAKKSQAVSSLIALGNKYFSQMLGVISGTGTNTPNPKGALPNLTGTQTTQTQSPPNPGIKTFAQLDAETLEIARSIAASQ